MTRRVGVDTGGTYTDIVSADGSVMKVLSSPDDPAGAVLEGVAAAGSADVVAHGTTVATNALLERRGGRVALYSTEGHADVIEIARQVRPSLYDPFVDRPQPLVPRHLRFDVPGRLDRDGHEIEPMLSAAALPNPSDVDAAAVVLLHSDRNPAHEAVVAAHLRARGLDVTASSDLSPEFREYERTVTTVANAYLRSPCRSYLLRLADAADQVLVMTSAGGLIPLAEAAERPVALLLSGPAGGVLAASAAAVAAGYPDAVTLDMGGTSTDVCLIRGGRAEPAAQRQVAGLPIRMPSLDVHTIGAGGGSIARMDRGGALVVGPESAGANPGPACYGRGGGGPTVTDANVVAGRLPEGLEFPGLGRLDADAARRALEKGEVSAEGVLAVVNANMVRAIRRVSVERGIDPRGLALVAFGGAGPLHACALADALGMPAVVVPPRAGVLSAAGMLAAPRQVDLVKSWGDPRDHSGAAAAMAKLAETAVAQLSESGPAVPPSALEVGSRSTNRRGGDVFYSGRRPEVGPAGPEVGPAGREVGPAGREVGSRSTNRRGGDVLYSGQGSEVGPAAVGSPRQERAAVPGGEAAIEVETLFDCRYAGQGHELSVTTIEEFGAEHRRRNGFARPGSPVEVVALRASARLPSPVQLADLPDPGGRSGAVVGPAVIAEGDCTIWVADGWKASVGGGGAWVLTR